ncbi:MAG: hypothetical protein MUF83_21940 [Acidimicrobiales bacterium]|jgi:hypothetical protein|nr:hypothetical protein [Acidimicrobiales bacterium]
MTRLGTLAVERSTVFATIGLTMVGVYLALLAYGMRYWPYDRWMLLVLTPLLVLLGSVIILVVTRRDVAPLTRLILVAFGVKLASAFVRYFVTVDIYGTGDSLRFDKEGAAIANAFHAGDLPLSQLIPTATGTAFLDGLTGLIYAVTGPSRLGGFLVFSWISFFGLFLFHRAALVGLPEGDQRRYALLMFFLPSLLFWPSSIGKEAVMMLALGACALGAARLLERRRLAWVPLGLGLGLAYMVRPHVPLVVLAALATAFLFRRRGKRPPLFGPLGRLVVVAGLIVVMAFVLGQVVDRFLPTTSEEGTTEAVGQLFDKAGGGTDEGSSAIDQPLPNSPLEYPAAAFTVLFRPTIIEASNLGLLLASLETTFLLTLFVLSWRRLRNIPTIMFRRPYVLFCVVYTGVFAFAWSSFSNLGALARQRVQVWPLLLLLLAVPVVVERVRDRSSAPVRHRSAIAPDPAAPRARQASSIQA